MDIFFLLDDTGDYEEYAPILQRGPRGKCFRLRRTVNLEEIACPGLALSYAPELRSSFLPQGLTELLVALEMTQRLGVTAEALA